jgi:hypothetical protein
MIETALHNTAIFPHINPSIGDIFSNRIPTPHSLSDSQYHILQGQYCRLEICNS